MSHPTPDASSVCAPYRAPTYAARPSTPPPPPLGPALGLALGAVTLAVSLATYTLVRAHRPAPPPAAVVVAARAAGAPSLVDAVVELSARHRHALFVAPEVAARAARAAVTLGSSDGSLPEAVRALDAYAATQGLWLHGVDGVLRLEREVTSVDLACDDTLAACTARLGRVAAVDVALAGGAAERVIHLRARRGEPAIERMRAAMEATGLRVDAVGRTLYASTDVPAAEAIRTAGPGRFVVRRDALDELIARAGSLRPAARIVPVVRAGRTVGVRVLSVQPGDLLARLGLESGDVLTRVNGYDVVSPDRCLEAYASLRRTDRLAVELLRRGRRVTLSYVLDPA